MLKFNPTSQKYETFMTTLTPEMAKYILINHNKDNRKTSKGQVNKIYKSIIKDGWLNDGGALTFNNQGNITEFQHRLEALVKADMSIEVPIVLGVKPDCFTKTAPAKPRTPKDEIQRKDDTALESEVSTLRELLLRRGGDKLCMNNAIEKWNYWKEYVREGVKMVDSFFNNVEVYNPFKRTFTAWAALSIFTIDNEHADNFLELLKNHISNQETTVLTTTFFNFFKEYSWEMSNSGRPEFIYKCLCVALDKIKKSPDGNIEFGNTLDQMDSSKLIQKGTYRQFLEDANNIKSII